MLTRDDILFSWHAVNDRMAPLGISAEEVLTVLNAGELIEPSLTFAMVNNRPLHVAHAQLENGKTLIITVYIPDAALWSADFRRRL